MNSVPPRLRPDLEIHPQSAKDGPVYVVKDPISGEFYRMREAEYFIARQLDGETSLEQIRGRAEQEFGATLLPSTLADFVKMLYKRHLLETPEAAAGAREGHGFVRGSSLYMRFKLWDPDSLLNRIVPRVEFLFTRWFLWASSLLILLALGTMIANRYELADEVPSFLRPESIPFVVVVLFALVSVHEFSHGVACKRYGGRVHEMGFMLLYFQPALYCNVSDAWLFTERRKRLVVAFAGPWIEMFLWALATLVWRFTDPGAAVHGLTLIVAGSAGVKTLLNFNPLMKYDGYYLLSDILDVPNLRTKSFRYIGALVKGFFGRPEERALDIEPRLRRIYLWYGLSAVAFSYTALAFAVLILGDYFLENRGPVSILIAVVLVAARARTRITRLFGHGRSGSREEEVMDQAQKAALAAAAAGAETSPRTESSSRAEAAPRSERSGRSQRSGRSGTSGRPETSSRSETSGRSEALVRAQRAVPATSSGDPDAAVVIARPRPVPILGAITATPPSSRWPAYAIGAVVLAAVLLTVHLELRVAGPFNVLPQENADVRAPLEQIVEEIYVDEGQRVRAGDRIARLDSRPLNAELAGTQASIQEARAILRKLEAGPTVAEKAVAKAGVAKGSDSLKYANLRVERLSTLFKQGLVSQKELEDAQEQATAAANNTSEADTRLHLLEVGTRPEEIAATRARIEQLESQRRYLEEQRALLDIVSPVAGVVATPTRQLKELRRQLVKKGDLIVKIYDMKTVTAQIFVSERELDGVRVGEKVELRARAYPGTTFHGQVTAIATSAQGSEGVVMQPGVFNSGGADPNKSILVTTQIDNPQLLLKPEMTGQAKIFCGSRTIAGLMARRVALTFRVALWSWW
jgi:putative peptide zinc metalloprotease protein